MPPTPLSGEWRPATTRRCMCRPRPRRSGTPASGRTRQLVRTSPPNEADSVVLLVIVRRFPRSERGIDASTSALVADHLQQDSTTNLDRLGRRLLMPTGEELQRYWLGRLPPGEKAVLAAATAAY